MFLFYDCLLDDIVSCRKLQCTRLTLFANMQIIDTTILDKQIVHSTLYKLWKDDYIDTEVSLIISSEK
jgi:hypothetical protein